MYGVVYGLSWAIKIALKYSKFRQRSPNFPRKTKNSNDRFWGWHLNIPSFNFCPCRAYHIYARGLTVEVDFRSQLCIDQYGEGFPCRQRTLITSQPIRRFFGSVLTGANDIHSWVKNFITDADDMPQGYWWYVSQVLNILTAVDDIPHGHCRQFT